MYKKKPFFIVFEGIEGCGKSYQSNKLFKKLKKKGLKPILTREPGGTKSSELIRKLILKDYFDKSTKDKFDKLVQMYLGIADHGNGGRIIIGNEITNWQKKDLNNIKIKFDINGDKSEPSFTGTKRIHPLKSLKAFIEEFKMQNISVKDNDYLLCGSLIHPYNIKKNDYIMIEYESLNKFEIRIK